MKEDEMHNVLEWLETTAERVPDKVAVADPELALTYAELRRAAEASGAWLLAAGVQPRTAVAFYLEKSALAWAAMLGAVYAGAFYSVLDVRQPEGRLHDMVGALQPAIIVCDEENVERAREVFADVPCELTLLGDVVGDAADSGAVDGATIGSADGAANGDVGDATGSGANATEALAEARARTTDVDPLYVNFTSGSTGTPKGVVVSHRSTIDFVGQFVGTFGLSEDDVVANQAPFDFDVSVKDLYGALATGATLVLVPRDYFSQPVQLMDYLCERDVTWLCWAVSALCFVSIMGGLAYRVPERIRCVLFSGEVMPPKQLAVWQEALPDTQYVNLYGPTEITCNCTYFRVERRYGNDEVIPMGRAFANERVFLLDAEDREVTEPGIEGEVCVVGTALALGYLGAPEVTAKAFVQNPLETRWLEPMYRTGDLARYDESGDLVYVSRKDHQIKHLGQRIELGDIEAAAHAVAGVERACCLYDAGRKRLILFYVGDIERKAVKARLRETLPQYMVPNNTKQLDEMPLNKNGKIDRNELAARARIKR